MESHGSDELTPGESMVQLPGETTWNRYPATDAAANVNTVHGPTRLSASGEHVIQTTFTGRRYADPVDRIPEQFRASQRSVRLTRGAYDGSVDAAFSDELTPGASMMQFPNETAWYPADYDNSTRHGSTALSTSGEHVIQTETSGYRWADPVDRIPEGFHASGERSVSLTRRFGGQVDAAFSDDLTPVQIEGGAQQRPNNSYEDLSKDDRDFLNQQPSHLRQQYDIAGPLYREQVLRNLRSLAAVREREEALANSQAPGIEGGEALTGAAASSQQESQQTAFPDVGTRAVTPSSIVVQQSDASQTPLPPRSRLRSALGLPPGPTVRDMMRNFISGRRGGRRSGGGGGRERRAKPRHSPSVFRPQPRSLTRPFKTEC